MMGISARISASKRLGLTVPFAVAASRMAISHQSTINPEISAENVLAVMERDEISVTSTLWENSQFSG